MAAKSKADDGITINAPLVPAEEVRTMGGMVAKIWAGHRMWECPSCGGTTFDATESATHSCKVAVFVKDLPPEEQSG